MGNHIGSINYKVPKNMTYNYIKQCLNLIRQKHGLPFAFSNNIISKPKYKKYGVELAGFDLILMSNKKAETKVKKFLYECERYFRNNNIEYYIYYEHLSL